jgi:Membrane-bound serine protease (ClpP class)
MRSVTLLFICIFSLNTLWASSETVTSGEKVVYLFNIRENIAPGIWRQTQKAFAEAESMKADLIVIRMNTYGGTVLDADSIRTKILNCPIPVYVFVDNNAASAGALISIACDSIYMREGGNIGAATVVNQTGEPMPDKYQSYMRSIMRSTAEAQGKVTVVNGNDTITQWRRNPHIAEAMVDESIYIEGIIDSGKVLTMTPTEAVKYGFCEGIRTDVQDVIEKAGISAYTISEYKTTLLDKIIGFLVNPVVSGLLIMAIIGGIYFEMQTPGIGFPLGVAITAAVLFFAPLYLEGLAEHWEILAFVIGLILIAAEIFVIPGFGIAGISGIILALGGLILSLLNNVKFNFEAVDPVDAFISVTTVLVAVTSAFFLSIWASSKLFCRPKRGFQPSGTPYHPANQRRLYWS